MKFKYIAIFAAAAFLTASCNEDSFLGEKPQGVLTDDIIQNGKEVSLLTNSAYSALMGPNPQKWSVWLYPTTNWTYGSVRADDAYKGGGGTGDCADIHKM